jgi:hypothetical protein
MALYLSVNAFSCSGVAASVASAAMSRTPLHSVMSFIEIFMAATVVGAVSAGQANFEQEKSLLIPVARAIPLSLLLKPSID